MHRRLDLAIGHLRAQGYRVIEGSCLRAQHQSASAPRDERAAELLRYLRDPDVAAIIPPWGGELASELLDFIDLEDLRSARPKWILGYSDTSTLLMPLTLVTGWATAHGPNLMDLIPNQSDPLTLGALRVLASDLSQSVTQDSSTQFQESWTNFATRFDAPLKLSEPTRWKRLDRSDESLEIRGRLIGGCFDTVSLLTGTPFGDVPKFVKSAGDEGVILYLENVAQSPGALVRMMLHLDRQGWFQGLRGVLLGRSAAKDDEGPTNLDYVGALESTLARKPFPVLFDLDIGHKPPQMTLINGALATVRFKDGAGSVSQVR